MSDPPSHQERHRTGPRPDGLVSVLFWDIDGTLLVTDRAGVFAWQDAARDCTGKELDLTSMRTAGLTDFAVAGRVLGTLGMQPDTDSVIRLVQRYEVRLPEHLRRRRGRVLPGVTDALDFLRTQRPDVVSYLLTGNTRKGARIKLAHFGLDCHFAEGGFSQDAGDRASIARCALATALQRHCVDAERIFVIGDTPHDIDCGRAIGARTLAVASGDYTIEELLRHRPWKAVKGIPAPLELLELLELVG